MMTPGSKYVQLLQAQPSSNNGTTLGGLGHVLQQALLGYAMGQDQREEEAKQGRLTQLLQMYNGTPDNTITWNQPTRPDGTGDRTTVISGQAPNPWGAINGLAELDPDLAIRLAQQQRNDPTTSNEVGTFLDSQGNPVLATYDDALARGLSPMPGQTPDNTPANVREWEYFSKLSPADQASYLVMRRNPTYLDLGNETISPDPLNPGGITARYGQGIAPFRGLIGDQVVTLSGVSGLNNPPLVNQAPPMQGGITVPPMQGSVTTDNPAIDTPQAGQPSGIMTSTIQGLPPNLTPAQETIDTAFANDVYVPLIASGGAADAMKNVQQLEGVLAELQAIADGKSQNNATGAVIGAMPDILGNVLAPGAMDMRQQVEEVVQRNLRLILGSQFTAEEGKQLIARAYNPSLDESVNAARLGRLVAAMKSALNARLAAAQYYEQNGTLAGFQGTAQFTMGDFYNAIGDDPASSTNNGWSIQQVQ